MTGAARIIASLAALAITAPPDGEPWQRQPVGKHHRSPDAKRQKRKAARAARKRNRR